MSATRGLLEELIRRPSLTPEDAGCTELLADRLAALGFVGERMDHEGVTNLWTVRDPQGAAGASEASRAPLIVFAEHTDVAPPGPRVMDRRAVAGVLLALLDRTMVLGASTCPGMSLSSSRRRGLPWWHFTFVDERTAVTRSRVAPRTPTWT